MDTEWLEKHWWSFAIRGVVAIVFGILTLVMPGISFRSEPSPLDENERLRTSPSRSWEPGGFPERGNGWGWFGKQAVEIPRQALEESRILD